MSRTELVPMSMKPTTWPSPPRRSRRRRCRLRRPWWPTPYPPRRPPGNARNGTNVSRSAARGVHYGRLCTRTRHRPGRGAASERGTPRVTRQDPTTLGDVEPKQRKKLDDDTYLKELGKLQIELVKLQEWIRARGLKVVTIFEGRDAAGKGGTIKRFTETLNPRSVRVVALGVPTEREKTEWYFQRYVRSPAGRRRVGDLRPLLVQPGRRRARHGLLQRRRGQRVLPLVPAVRRDAHPQRHHPREVLVQRQRRRAGAALQGPHPGPHQALEDLRDGPRELGQVGRVLARQGRDVPLHRHQALALVRGQLRRQEARPPERHSATC